MKRAVNIFYIILFPFIIFAQIITNSDYEGLWRSSEYAETLEIVGDSVIIYQETSGKLLKKQFTSGQITDHILTTDSNIPFGGSTSNHLLLAGDILTLVEKHSGQKYLYKKIKTKPEIIEHTEDPYTNLNYFWTMQNERYPYFSERDIDWKKAKKYLDSLNNNIIEKEELWDHLKVLVDYFKNDGHIWIGDKKGENFYTPTHMRISQSIKPKKDLLFLIGEKYLDQHKYLTTAKGKIIYKYLADSIGYINIMSFYKMSDRVRKSDQLNDISKDLDSLYFYFKSANGIIVDMRYNGGGNDWAALKCTGLFLNDSKPVISKRSRIQRSEKYSLPEVSIAKSLPNNLSNIPKVVLSSGFSASATETFLIAAMLFPNSVTIGEESKGIL